MFTSKFLSRIGTIATILMLALGSTQPALAVGSNDNFADATVIGSLPFITNADTSGASFEAGEPYPNCGYGYYLRTVWYAYTPTTNVTVTARANYYYFPPLLAVYTGDSINNLNQIACGNYGSQFTLQTQAGVTYYFQLSSLYDWNEGIIPFSLEVTPPPQVDFGYSPGDPTMFEAVAFWPWYSDPIGVASFAWSTSDGATSDQYNLYHQFAADGDYTVSLTATTYDGRSGSATKVVQVRTRDIAITKFSIPQTAKSNTTKTISVDVSNKRYSDYVAVTLYKGLPGGGEQQIGTLSIYVPARANRPTTFKFSYTFTPSDVTIGKVTFRVVATPNSGRDALPADNTAIGTTLVTGP